MVGSTREDESLTFFGEGVDLLAFLERMMSDFTSSQ